MAPRGRGAAVWYSPAGKRVRALGRWGEPMRRRQFISLLGGGSPEVSNRRRTVSTFSPTLWATGSPAGLAYAPLRWGQEVTQVLDIPNLSLYRLCVTRCLANVGW